MKTLGIQIPFLGRVTRAEAVAAMNNELTSGGCDVSGKHTKVNALIEDGPELKYWAFALVQVRMAKTPDTRKDCEYIGYDYGGYPTHWWFRYKYLNVVKLDKFIREECAIVIDDNYNNNDNGPSEIQQMSTMQYVGAGSLIFGVGLMIYVLTRRKR